MVGPTAPHEARAYVRQVLDGWGEGDRDGEAEIIASELATNAVRHARSPFRVSVNRTEEAIRIAVRDASTDRPRHIMRDDFEVGGRGVRLIAALSKAWGSSTEADGKTVWAEVAR
jgi:anti-sigma regulatory factor (Ser/Thr protein kinase)